MPLSTILQGISKMRTLSGGCFGTNIIVEEFIYSYVWQVAADHSEQRANMLRIAHPFIT